MPKADFYLLDTALPRDVMQFACRLVEKAWRQRHRIYCHMADTADAHALDEMLWTWRDDSFLPHNLYGEGPEPAPPIQIGTGVQPAGHTDILINLSQQVLPDWHTQFTRILEIIPADETAQASARERYRQYREKHYPLQTHKTETAEHSHE